MAKDYKFPHTFSYKEWLASYNEMHSLGKRLNKTRPIGLRINFDERKSLSKRIDRMASIISNKLDASGLHLPKPLWDYSLSDETTWISDSSFDFHHLIKRG